MLKRKILLFLANRKLQKAAKLQAKSFRDATSIGILVNVHDNHQRLDEMVQDLRKDGKDTTIMNVDSQGFTQGKNQFPSISRKDISFFGELRSQHLLHFTSKQYDFLLILDHQLDYFIQYIAAHCPAGCRVGFSEYPGDAMDLQIKPDANRELEDVLKYTRMINHD